MKYHDWMCNQGRYLPDYRIPQEGPIEGRWERIMSAFDWVCIGLLAACCLGMVHSILGS